MIITDGQGEIVLVNLSGRPRDSVLWFGAGGRRARDIRGREDEWFAEAGWTGLRSTVIPILPSPISRRKASTARAWAVSRWWVTRAPS